MADNQVVQRHILPLGFNIDTYTYQHLLQPPTIPYAKNLRLEPGAVIKRPGRTVIYDMNLFAAGTKILRVFPVSDTIALVFTGVKGADLAAQSGKVYEWNYVPDKEDAEFKLIDITPELYGSGIGLYDKNKWRCFKHYDQCTGESQTICLNGWDLVIKYVPEGGTATWTNPNGQTVTATGHCEALIDMTGRVASNLPIIALYGASFYDAVYLANITDDGYYGATTLEFSAGEEFSAGVDGLDDGDILIGETTGAVAVIDTSGVTVSGGSWAGGDAYGTLAIVDKIGIFAKGEKLQVTRGGTTVEHICTTNGTLGDPFAIVWSMIADSGDFSVSDYYQRRNEDDLPINGIIKYSQINTGEDWLIMSKGTNKGRNQLWRILPYSNFSCINPSRGFSNNDGAIVTGGGELVFNDKGRILDYSGNDISAKVAKYMKSSDPGNWDLNAIDKEYDDQILFSTGRHVFVYDKKSQNWAFDVYDKDVEIWCALPAGRSAKQMVGKIRKHTQYSAIEEDIMSDVVFSYDDSKLCVTNHFASDDDGEEESNINFELRTPLLPIAGSPSAKARLLYIEITSAANTENSPTGPFTLSGFFSDTPRQPEWTEIGTIEIDENGHGERWFAYDPRCVWAAFRITGGDTNMVKLYDLIINWVPTSMR